MLLPVSTLLLDAPPAVRAWGAEVDDYRADRGPWCPEAAHEVLSYLAASDDGSDALNAWCSVLLDWI